MTIFTFFLTEEILIFSLPRQVDSEGVEFFCLLPEQSGWRLSRCPMGEFSVIDRDPFVGNLSDLM